jgi:hypothetical protein
MFLVEKLMKLGTYLLWTHYTSNYIMINKHNIIINITKENFATKSKDC